MTATGTATAVYLTMRPAMPVGHDSGKGHLTVWSVVFGAIFPVAVLGFQFYRRSRRK